MVTSTTSLDSEDFTMYPLNKETIAEESMFINEETQGLQGVVLNESAVGVDLPTIVELVIVETAPAMKGASATSRTKPATLSTGLVVQVPEHIAEGDRIKVNTDGKLQVVRTDLSFFHTSPDYPGFFVLDVDILWLQYFLKSRRCRQYVMTCVSVTS